MSVQEACPRMRLQPGGEKAAAFGVALLELGMGKPMCRIGVFRPQSKRPFGDASTGPEMASLGVRPAQIGKEPPILAVMIDMALADRDARRIVIGAPGKGIEAERAEQQRQHQRVPRVFFQVLLCASQCDLRPSLDRGGGDLDMRALARAGALRKLPRLRGQGARLRPFHVHLVDTGTRDVREREVRIFGDGGVKVFRCTVPGRKQAVDAIAIKRGGAVRGGRKRQIGSGSRFIWHPRTGLIQGQRSNALRP